MENGRELNAFITETADIAREKAIDSDNRYLKGEEKSFRWHTNRY